MCVLFKFSCKLPSAVFVMQLYIDVYSRLLLGWRLTKALDSCESMETLMGAIRCCARPALSTTTMAGNIGMIWHDSFQRLCIRQSMNGRWRYNDNIWTERFWRILKRDCVYLNLVDTTGEMRRCIAGSINYYNNKRHQGIDKHIPAKLCPKEILSNKNNNKQRVAG